MQAWLDHADFFAGSKIAVVCGDTVLTYRRDDVPDIPFPGLWDLPGGESDPFETPESCALRELEEETGLSLERDRLTLGRAYPDHRGTTWFYLTTITEREARLMRFPAVEGSHWGFRPISEYLSRSDAVPALQRQLRDALPGAHP